MVKTQSIAFAYVLIILFTLFFFTPSASTFEYDQLVPGMSYNVELQAIRGDVVAASRLRFTSTAVSSPLEPRKRNNDRLNVLADRDMIADEIPYPVDARSMQQDVLKRSSTSKKGGSVVVKNPDTNLDYEGSWLI